METSRYVYYIPMLNRDADECSSIGIEEPRCRRKAVCRVYAADAVHYAARGSAVTVRESLEL